MIRSFLRMITVNAVNPVCVPIVSSLATIFDRPARSDTPNVQVHTDGGVEFPFDASQSSSHRQRSDASQSIIRSNDDDDPTNCAAVPCINQTLNDAFDVTS